MLQSSIAGKHQGVACVCCGPRGRAGFLTTGVKCGESEQNEGPWGAGTAARMCHTSRERDMEACRELRVTPDPGEPCSPTGAALHACLCTTPYLSAIRLKLPLTCALFLTWPSLLLKSSAYPPINYQIRHLQMQTVLKTQEYE